MTVVETDLACEREKRRVTTRQSPTTDTHRFGCGFDLTALTRGVSYPGTTATTDPRRRRRDDDDDATRPRRRERKTFHSRRASPRFASRPIARATSVPSSSLIIAHHRARGARYAATHPSPRTARATRFTPARARGRIERIETRTWTLVALKAATRPTKEEARSADIIVVSECAGMTLESIARAGSIAPRTTSCGLVLVLYTYRQGFRILVYGRPVVYSCVRASYPTPRRLDGVRGVHTSGVRAS